MRRFSRQRRRRGDRWGRRLGWGLHAPPAAGPLIGWASAEGGTTGGQDHRRRVRRRAPGHVRISAVSNVIMRNLKVVGNNCADSPTDCSDGADAISVTNQSHHVWFDHMDIGDMLARGNLFTNTTGTTTATGTGFTPPYAYELDETADLEPTIRAQAGPH